MKSVLIFLCVVVALSHHAFAATCLAIKQYSTTLQPECTGDDIDILWPNYENFTQYYRCQGTGNSVLTNCALDTFFCYNLQMCTTCAKFIPAPDCENLVTETKAVCVATTVTEAPVTQAPVPTIRPYNTTLQPACIGRDINTLWPNYENISQYYKCLSNGYPVLANCAFKTYFTYYLQMCTTSDKFESAPKCELLDTQNKPVCVPITPIPTEIPTAAPTGKPTEAPTEAPSTPTPESTTPENTTAETPSPPTQATDALPTPPNVGGPGIPTPPAVEVIPPTEV